MVKSVLYRFSLGGFEQNFGDVTCVIADVLAWEIPVYSSLRPLPVSDFV